ncbi:OLD family endonuclease [Vibrio splendidus]|uniref:AAA family ATPase n=1 Tax=Vibrio splendidus TaxID=29497 RepID=UPI000C8350BD|nr:AAA family ATPase [Vibrio splendidus]PMO04108.1 OLD family endonuclease [Vibrio splendidus]
MRLYKARIQNYRSVIDSGEFEVEKLKTIFVGPNEAGKTVILRALQQLNKPDDTEGFDALRDYPRALYNDITSGKIDVNDVEVVTGIFTLDDEDKEELNNLFHDCQYQYTRKLNNKATHQIIGGPEWVKFSSLEKNFARIIAHMDKQFGLEDNEQTDKPSTKYSEITSDIKSWNVIKGQIKDKLTEFLKNNLIYIDEDNTKEEERYDKLLEQLELNSLHDQALTILSKRIPVFILFNNYFKVKPLIYLQHLAARVNQNILDDEAYDYGNLCLLKLLGFTPDELSELGSAVAPGQNDVVALKNYRDKLDRRSYQLNAASVKLTKEICSAWMPDHRRGEADNLKVTADGQYLKVVVVDNLGVEIELDQRSEGFQWLVSFFVVFFSESMDKHKNAILLLDEPGMSLHALKQRDFRETISRLALNNQTIFSTHSPFLVGPDELDLVRVIEMTDREIGTKVHTTLSSSDATGILPLQESLGYDLASSLFSQSRNLVLEGITDYWYIEATSQLLAVDDVTKINEKIALVFANSAGKVVYYSTILHAHKLKVAALLDSDAAGDQAAQQENLVHTLGNKNILRTKDFCDVPKAEIEDLLRYTLPIVAGIEYNIDVSQLVSEQPERPIVDILAKEIKGFSKYRLAKAYVRWTRENKVCDLHKDEVEQWSLLIKNINKCLK